SPRTFFHKHADKARGYRLNGKSQGDFSTSARYNFSQRECFPNIRQSLADVIDAGKMSILHVVDASKRLGPINLNSIYWRAGSQIDQNPLRQFRILLAGEMLVQIRVTLPEAVEVSIIET